MYSNGHLPRAAETKPIPMDMDHCSGCVSKEEEIGRFTGPKLTADRVAHRARYPFIWKKDATRGILEMLTHGLPQTPPLTRVVQDRGNNTGTTWGGNHPKGSQTILNRRCSNVFGINRVR